MSLKKNYLKSRPVCKVTFSLPSEAVPEDTEVRVLGDWNGWEWQEGLPLERKNAEYSVVIELPNNGMYEFKYCTEDGTWINDWQADGYLPSPYGNDNSMVETFVPATSEEG